MNKYWLCSKLQYLLFHKSFAVIQKSILLITQLVSTINQCLWCIRFVEEIIHRGTATPARNPAPIVIPATRTRSPPSPRPRAPHRPRTYRRPRHYPSPRPLTHHSESYYATIWIIGIVRKVLGDASLLDCKWRNEKLQKLKSVSWHIPTCF